MSCWREGGHVWVEGPPVALRWLFPWRWPCVVCLPSLLWLVAGWHELVQRLQVLSIHKLPSKEGYGCMCASARLFWPRKADVLPRHRAVHSLHRRSPCPGANHNNFGRHMQFSTLGCVPRHGTPNKLVKLSYSFEKKTWVYVQFVIQSCARYYSFLSTPYVFATSLDCF